MSVAAKIQQAMESQSWIRQMFELGIQLKREHGDENVFDLSLGNPILEPPAEVAEALKRLASDPPAGMHRYMPNAGYAETRGAIAAHLASGTGLGFTAAHTVMTCGAGGALNVIFKSILNPGEEVIIFCTVLPGVPVLRGQPRRDDDGRADGRGVPARTWRRWGRCSRRGRRRCW